MSNEPQVSTLSDTQTNNSKFNLFQANPYAMQPFNYQLISNYSMQSEIQQYTPFNEFQSPISVCNLIINASIAKYDRIPEIMTMLSYTSGRNRENKIVDYKFDEKEIEIKKAETQKEDNIDRESKAEKNAIRRIKVEAALEVNNYDKDCKITTLTDMNKNLINFFNPNIQPQRLQITDRSSNDIINNPIPMQHPQPVQNGYGNNWENNSSSSWGPSLCPDNIQIASNLQMYNQPQSSQERNFGGHSNFFPNNTNLRLRQHPNQGMNPNYNNYYAQNNSGFGM